MSRKDSKGSFLRNERALDSFGGAPQGVTDAYIVWALATAGYGKMVVQEIDHLVELTKTESDPYIVGLTAATLYEVQRVEEADTLSRRLVEKLSTGGVVAGAATTITSSGGSARDIETTAIAIIAWLHNGSFTPQARRAMEWLTTQCQDGRFSSTQATILALKAIIAYDKATFKLAGTGSITLKVDGEVVQTQSFSSDTKDAIEFDSQKLTAILSSSSATTHSLSVEMVSSEKDVAMPVSFAASLNTLLPTSVPASPVIMTASLSSTTVTEGEGLDILVSVRNTQSNEVPMTLAVVGIPGGLEVRYDQLDELRRRGEIAFYEMHNSDLVLYWRGMSPNQSIKLKVDAVAKIPGTYVGASSRSYLYYTDELKAWVAGMKVEVKAQDEKIM